MHSAVLSLLLMGMLPVLNAPHADQATLGQISIASPSSLQADLLHESHLEEEVSASGMLVYDLQSGQQLYGLHAGEPREIGSLAKLMTAEVIAEHHGMDEIVTVPGDIRSVDGSTANLPPGQHFTVGDLLSALLINSANDAAVTLARFHSGTSSAFAGEMNTRARELGLTQTSFVNPIGFDDPHQTSTPAELAWLTSFVLRNPEIRRRMSTKTLTIHSLEGQAISLTHTLKILHDPASVIAGKTGTTDEARQCADMVVQEGDKQYVVVVLGSRDRYRDLRMILKVLETPLT